MLRCLRSIETGSEAGEINRGSVDGMSLIIWTFHSILTILSRMFMVCSGIG
jgi:hypothetical protein